MGRFAFAQPGQEAADPRLARQRHSRLQRQQHTGNIVLAAGTVGGGNQLIGHRFQLGATTQLQQA